VSCINQKICERVFWVSQSTDVDSYWHNFLWTMRAGSTWKVDDKSKLVFGPFRGRIKDNVLVLKIKRKHVPCQYVCAVTRVQIASFVIKLAHSFSENSQICFPMLSSTFTEFMYNSIELAQHTLSTHGRITTRKIRSFYYYKEFTCSSFPFVSKSESESTLSSS
jgi:hypothetical protein